MNADAPVPPLDDGCIHLWWIAGGPETPQQRRARVDALLRSVLANYLAQHPDALRFGREARGRPFLLAGQTADGAPPPDFNLSDTRGGTVVAVARGLRVGVDLERTDRALSHRALAPRYFAAEEATALAALPEEPARRAFLALWTAKEAACKATGTGIYGQLATWRFVVAEGEPQLRAAPPAAGADGWSFRRVAPAPAYTAVVACRGVIRGLRQFELPA